MINIILGICSLFLTGWQQPSPANNHIGMGMAKPHLTDGKLIYFYHLPPFDQQPYQLRPVDSIIIRKGEYHFEISYAPPWFYPEIMKLDYDMLFLKTITLSNGWLEVVVNKQTTLSYWILRDDAEFIAWSDFLLDIFSVELINPKTNPLLFKPHKDASIVATTPPRFDLKPLAIQDDWMMVSTNGLAGRIVPTAWIRWRNNDSLLIRYSILN